MGNLKAEDARKKSGLPVPSWVFGLLAFAGLAFVASRSATVSAPVAEPPSQFSLLEAQLEAELAAALAPPVAPPLAVGRVVAAPRVSAPGVAAAAARPAVSAPPATVPLLAATTGPAATSLKPMWGLQHVPTNDVVMALGFGYTDKEFARFVGTLRRVNFPGDIVLATEPEARMKKGAADYLRSEGVLAYGFTYECVKSHRRRRLMMTPAGCHLTNWYANGDSRGPRPLAVARYEMYRSWLLHYTGASWGIIFDFRDTYFQKDPFPLIDRSASAPNLHLFAENRKVKTVGNCVFNSGWLRCWGKGVPKTFANNSVVCSGSTMGSHDILLSYAERMIAEMDKMQCHATPARTESDQGYHNYLYDSGELARLPGARVIHHEQGEGFVNTIGAMNGFRVPAHMKGPLDTFWKIRDSEGYLLDYNGERSAVVHQWDRFHKEMVKFIDSLVRDHMHTKNLALA